ncbi:ComEC/Rec2 family competence protein [Clostridium oceanicum]|uniref:ComEC/Rec2 family competence protein n=1 Tax=Clostridium oceanicum TaxID=1543 RepID=A0ABN1JVE1_9CLOT
MNKPLVYYCISLCLGCVSALIIMNNRLLGAAFTASFFIFFFITMDRKFMIFTLIFFVFGIFGYFNYFNVRVSNKCEVRITEKDKYYYKGEWEGRNINITGKLKGVKEGDRIYTHCEFKKRPVYGMGIIGDLKVDTYKLKNKDLISRFTEIKEKVYKKFKSELGEEKSAIVMALCFGETKYINNNQKDMMKKFGIIHVFSVSGLHVGIVYGILQKILGSFLALPMCFIYIMFTGIKPSCLRAFVMIIVLKLSKICFKEYDSVSALSLAAIIILLIKPYYILNAGFILSFLSTLGIILYYKKIQRVFYKIPKILNESLSLTLSSQVYSFPYICFSIKKFGLGFILGNLILVPIYGIIVLIGNLSLVLIKISFVFSILSKFIYFILTIVEGINLILDNILPEIIEVSYFEGISFILVYISYKLYKGGYKKIKYFPMYVFIIFFVINYNVFPKINLYKDKGVSCISVKYKGKCTMICNYDLELGKEVLKLKEINKPTKVITNPSFEKTINLNKDFKIKVFNKNKYNVNSVLYYKNYRIPISYEKYFKRPLKSKKTSNIDDKTYFQSKYVLILGKFYNSNF